MYHLINTFIFHLVVKQHVQLKKVNAENTLTIFDALDKDPWAKISVIGLNDKKTFGT